MVRKGHQGEAMSFETVWGTGVEKGSSNVETAVVPFAVFSSKYFFFFQGWLLMEMVHKAWFEWCEGGRGSWQGWAPRPCFQSQPRGPGLESPVDPHFETLDRCFLLLGPLFLCDAGSKWARALCWWWRISRVNTCASSGSKCLLFISVTSPLSLPWASGLGRYLGL